MVFVSPESLFDSVPAIPLLLLNFYKKKKKIIQEKLVNNNEIIPSY